uniref:Uncharacterized protein n=1 Tax=Octopus bimaculoides TaxID=37653 RepID=A0A0L8I6S7_OCTBM
MIESAKSSTAKMLRPALSQQGILSIARIFYTSSKSMYLKQELCIITKYLS